MKKSLLWLLILIVCVSMVVTFSLIGCKKEAAPKTEEEVAPEEKVAEEAVGEASTAEAEVVAEEGYTFYMVSHSSPADPYWAVVNQGLIDAAEKFGVNVVFSAPDKYSIEGLINIFESVIDAAPDGIAISTTDPVAMESTLEKAIDAGIPLVNYDSKDDRGEIPYITYIGGDEWYNGHYCAVAALEKFTPTHVIIGWHEPGHAAHAIRAGAVKEVLDENNIPYTEVDITVDLATQMEAFSAAFQKNPEADAIYTMGPPGTIGALKFIEQNNLKGKVKIFCQDFSPEILDAIKAGDVVVAASQQPYLQGFLSVVTLYTYLAYGQAPVSDIITSVRMVDINNVDDVIKLAAEHRSG